MMYLQRKSSSQMATPCSSSMNGTQHLLDRDEKSMEFNRSDNPSLQTLMMSTFGLSGGSRVPEALHSADFTMEDREIQRSFKGKKRRTMSQCASFLPLSPTAKNDVSADLGNRDTKEQKSELLFPGQISSKLVVKEAKDRFHDDDDDDDVDDKKEKHIHVRAKRGKATNSHSLAERVRREKISERMRILQDIVPGCNKITGKAVMLDEIINYVQSLQQQVEFLSMKLAAVNPELSIAVEQNSSKAVRQGTPFLGLSPFFSTPYDNPHYTGLGGIQIPSEMLVAATISQLSSIAQIENIWDEELRNSIHMAFIPPQAVNNSEFHGTDPKVL